MSRIVAMLSGDDDLTKLARACCRGLPPHLAHQPLSLNLYLSTDECLAALTLPPSEMPVAVIVDMSTIDVVAAMQASGPKSQGTREEQGESDSVSPPPPSVIFFQKLRAMESHRQTPVIVTDDAITARHLALSSDYGFFRLVEGRGAGGAFKAAIEAVAAELSRPAMIRQSFARAAQAMRDGLDGDADGILEECYQLHKDDPEVLLEYGNHFMRRGMTAKVDRAFAKLADLAEPPLRITSFLARVEMKRGNTAAALGIMEKADLLSPGNLERLVLMGDALRLQGDWKNAEVRYEQALAVDSSSAAAGRGLGMAALQQGDVDRALDIFSVHCSEEETAAFFNNTAILAVKRSQFERARGLYAAASTRLENPGTKAKVFFNMGLMYRRWGKPVEAAESFREALSHDRSLEKADRHLALVGPGTAAEPAKIPDGAELADLSATKFSDLILSDAERAAASLRTALPAVPSAGKVITKPDRDGGGIRNVAGSSQEVKPFSVGKIIAQGPRQRGISSTTAKQLASLGESAEDVIAKPIDRPATESSMGKVGQQGQGLPRSAPKTNAHSQAKTTQFIDDEDEDPPQTADSSRKSVGKDKKTG